MGWGGAAGAGDALAGPAGEHATVHIKQRQRGYDEPAYVESLVVLHALGGDCVDDLDRLREDPGRPLRERQIIKDIRRGGACVL